jgi:hypothetical protein
LRSARAPHSASCDCIATAFWQHAQTHATCSPSRRVSTALADCSGAQHRTAVGESTSPTHITRLIHTAYLQPQSSPSSTSPMRSRRNSTTGRLTPPTATVPTSGQRADSLQEPHECSAVPRIRGERVGPQAQHRTIKGCAWEGWLPPALLAFASLNPGQREAYTYVKLSSDIWLPFPSRCMRDGSQTSHSGTDCLTTVNDPRLGSSVYLGSCQSRARMPGREVRLHIPCGFEGYSLA